jgi:nuclear cap-binding protein subunit 1
MVIDTSGGAAGSPLVLENLIVEIILGSYLFATPSPPHKAVYYQSLIGELCKISPQTVAPALGKCIRKLYAGLGSAVDGAAADGPKSKLTLGPEQTRRFAEWFAVHLSNFGFHWRWPEW